MFGNEPYQTQHEGREMILVFSSYSKDPTFLLLPHPYYLAHFQIWYRDSQPSITIVLFSLARHRYPCTHKAEYLNLF